MNKISSKTLAMKARAYNVIRKELYKKRLDQITNEEKLSLFDKFFVENLATHWELINYKEKRREKSALQKEREKRGWNPKKKTSLVDYKNMQKNLVDSK